MKQNIKICSLALKHCKSSKTCSHTVAVAHKTGNLDKYIKWYSTTNRKGPGMTAVAEAGKPATAGKKRKRISKKSSKHQICC